MDDVLDDLAIQVRRCENAAKTLTEGKVADQFKRLLKAVDEAGRAWSGSWIGYQSRVYYRDLRPPPPGDYFSIEWGFQSHYSGSVSDDWLEYPYEAVADAVVKKARLSTSLDDLTEKGREVGKIAESARDEMLATLDAVRSENLDTRLAELRAEIAKVDLSATHEEIGRSMMPRGQILSRDAVAMEQGIRLPPHLGVQAFALAAMSNGLGAAELAKVGRRAILYLEKRMKLRGASVAKRTGTVFVGHGRSPLWRELKDFLQDRLGLRPDEYNLESAAGMSTTERLQEMLDKAIFAFLIMTGEDEHADTTLHARENVIHEAGLFQGRLGFRRAILLVEEGCKTFSNVEGITQIRFPKGDISAKFEEVRRVLEREGVERH